MSENEQYKQFNVATLREAYRRWRETRGGSIDFWISICAPDIRFGSLPQGAEPLDYMRGNQGREGLREYLDGIVANWDMIEHETERFVADGDEVVMLGYCRWRARATGKAVWTPLAHFWRFQNGLAIEYYEFFDTAAAISAGTPD